MLVLVEHIVMHLLQGNNLLMSELMPMKMNFGINNQLDQQVEIMVHQVLEMDLGVKVQEPITTTIDDRK